MRSLATTLSLLLLAAAPLEAQRIVVAEPGPGAPGRILRETLASTHVVIDQGGEPVLLPPGERRDSTLVILAPSVTVEGEVSGNIIVIGGDLYIRPGAVVRGRGVAIGGGAYPSFLADVSHGLVSYRDATFDAERAGGVITLRYRSLRVGDSPLFDLPGLSGFGIPTYDRTNGLAIAFTPLVTLASSKVVLQPAVTYRSQLGVFDPSLDATLHLGGRTHVEGFAGRLSFTNEEWITSDLLNSISSIFLGRDVRNWYRADRGELRLHHRLETPTLQVVPYVGGRIERAWSARPDSAPASGPWSLFGRTDDEGMLRPNPPADAGRIHSALGGAAIVWESQGVRARLRGDVEVAYQSPTSEFTQTTLDGDIRFPTFGTQRFRLEMHAVLTSGTDTPSQRWAYMGGSGTISTLDVLEMGGDQLFFTDARYEIPIDRVVLPLVGSPMVTLRHLLGSAGVDELPELVQAVGVRVSVKLLRAEILVDTKEKKPKLSAGIALSR